MSDSITRREFVKQGAAGAAGAALVLAGGRAGTVAGMPERRQLEENVAIAASFKPMSKADLARIEGLTASYESEGAWFKKGGQGFSRPGDDDQNTD